MFANYEKQHANRTYDYLKQNNLLLAQINEDTIPQEELNKIINSIKIMYEKHDEKLIQLLNLINKRTVVSTVVSTVV